jgi:hypothetical protein
MIMCFEFDGAKYETDVRGAARELPIWFPD